MKKKKRQPLNQDQENAAQIRHQQVNPKYLLLMTSHQQKWRDRFQEFKAWTLLEAQQTRVQTRDVLLHLVSRFTTSLQDWWNSLGEYRQLQFLQEESVDRALNHIYTEFCGQQAQIT
ncbi:hypothetical protein L484_021723 [Morus notabilis]|uniref:Uncharacterized protein n=1 Tax=Morus notabilis TaxID=981085 RepID=W9RW72_9ROSA|nr:hypothetical protein L484_021723 [Morus notabilis]